jgi:hypothetical protein
MCGYPLIESCYSVTFSTFSCPANSSHAAVHVYPSDVDKVRFSFRAFEFSAQHGVVYVHCEVNFCRARDAGCVPGCHAGSRRRRDVDSASKSHLISAGPFVLVADEGW